MTFEQQQAAKALQHAFERCNRSGLSAAIYDGSVCFWPSQMNPQEFPNPMKTISEHGDAFRVPGMFLDGGAGN